jgi:hypothetical protein
MTVTSVQVCSVALANQILDQGKDSISWAHLPSQAALLGADDALFRSTARPDHLRPVITAWNNGVKERNFVP